MLKETKVINNSPLEMIDLTTERELDFVVVDQDIFQRLIDALPVVDLQTLKSQLILVIQDSTHLHELRLKLDEKFLFHDVLERYQAHIDPNVNTL